MATVYLIATPFGNLSDISLRALQVLAEVDALACEDTRRTARLLNRHQIPRPAHVMSCHEHNEQKAAARIVALLDRGRDVGLCSNAGTPAISDPGYVVTAAAIAAGHRAVPLPGASAVTAALSASGLPVSSYTFKGFPPRKAGRRRAFLETDRDLPHTLVFFEGPTRIRALLAAALEVLGDRRAALCIELTKKFERVARGYISDLLAQLGDEPGKGEVTLVIAGSNPKFMRQSSASRAPS
jgi:16S rRNA (cytidine1402-2'-O)-methyltransferase